MTATVVALVVAVLAASSPAAAQGGAAPEPSATAACPAGGVPSAGFGDVPPGHEHAASVDCLVWWGLATGAAPGRFAPDEAVTRGQVATILARLLEQTGDRPLSPPPSGFADVAASVHRAGVDVLAAAGVIDVPRGGRFRPAEPATRTEVASVLARMLEVVYDLDPAASGVLDDLTGRATDPGADEPAAGVGHVRGVSDEPVPPGDALTRAEAASAVVGAADFLVRAERAALPSPVTTPASEGCRRAEARSGDLVVAAGSTRRTFRLQLPDGYAATAPHGLVLVFGDDAAVGEQGPTAVSGELSQAFAGSAVVANLDPHPDAPWDHGSDVAFVDAVLAELREVVCLDEDRLFAVGHGLGAVLVNELGCTRGHLLAAIAVVAGTGPDPHPAGACVGTTSAWVAHGTDDPLVPLAWGEATRAHWVEANGCHAATEPFGSGVIHRWCDAGRLVAWVEHDQGHAFPDFAAHEIRRFFART